MFNDTIEGPRAPAVKPGPNSSWLLSNRLLSATRCTPNRRAAKDPRDRRRNGLWLLFVLTF